MTHSTGSPRAVSLLALSVFAACVLGALLSGASAQAAGGKKTLVLYATAEQEQYVNNSDSLQRGEGNNPFGNYKDLEPLANKNANGPFPGDEALFSFNLYSGPSLAKRVGTALFTCQYNFNKNAFCDASFQMTSGGTVIASGAFNFTASKFSLAITGGYGAAAYVNKRGSLTDVPSPNHAQKLSFQFD
jgi:hypothetical protein